MTYLVHSVQFAQSSDTVFSVDWSFKTDLGAIRSTHVLSLPKGPVPADKVTTEVLIEWLKQQLPDSEEAMTASIAAEHARKAEAANVVSLELLPGQTVQTAMDELHHLQELARRSAAPEWNSTATYQLNDLVTHNGKVYRKSDSSDNTEPDNIPGGWEPL